ncbi:MAG TPA: flagellar basal body L-ring protein FlgH [Alphaproteobacteria bacterium]|nr:flagellar basal body L-ring protein FlgH [Alphaproteobacteria bacterium]
MSLKFAALAAAVLLLSGCNAIDRLGRIGEEPPLTRIENPVQQKGYQPVVLPMPRQQAMTHQPNSLWRPGARAFFKDQRAAQIGDILTVNIAIDDQAAMQNETTRARSSAETNGLTNFLGYENELSKVLPEGVTPSSLVDLSGDSSSTGKGTVDRKESVNLTVAAIVTQVLPNGNLVISGTQEVRVNYEKRMLHLTGVVRPEDISATNTIKHTQIAEARISYGGEGQISDLQQPRYGQQLFDVVFPF